MEEQKTKKNKTPMIVMAIAVVLILAGVVLLVTGNNKSFLGSDDKKENKNTEEQEKPVEPTEPEDDPNRGLVPVVLSEEEVIQLILNKKQSEFSDETWSLGAVTIIGHDEKNEKFLVSYEEIGEDGTVVVKQTIVSVLNEEKNVELPGWIEGERDLTVYNFIIGEVVEPTEPVNPDQPVDPVQPVDPTVPVDPTMPVEPTAPVAPVEPTEQVNQ